MKLFYKPNYLLPTLKYQVITAAALLIFAVSVFPKEIFVVDFYGIVLDMATKGPISNATVAVSGISDATITNSDGEFNFQLAQGSYTFHINASGYLDLSEMLDTEDATTVQHRFYLIRLSPKTEIIGESLEQEISKSSFTQNDLETTPGNRSNDVINAIVTSFAGISFGNNQNPAAFSVRGSSPEDNLFFLDGLVGLYPFHFRGYVSVFPSDMVKQIDFYTGGFPAGIGHVTGSVMDIKSKDQQPNQLNGVLDLNLYTAELYFTAPISDNTYFIASIRRSYLELIRQIFTLRSSRSFFDYYGKIGYRPNAYNQIEINAFGAWDVEEVDATAPVNYSYNFYTQGINWKWSPNENIFSELVMGYTYSTFTTPANNVVYSQPNDYGFNDASSDLLLNYHLINYKYTFELSLGQKNTFNFGLLGLMNFIPYSIRDKLSQNSIQQGQLDFHNHSAFLGYILDLKWLIFNMGADVNLFFFSADGSTQGVKPTFSPKLSFKLPINEQNKIFASIGLYYQNPNESYLVPNFGDPSLPEKESFQFILGYERIINPLLMGKVELYYKNVNNVPTRKRSDPNSVVLQRGFAYGVDLMLNQKLWRHFEGGLVYSFIYSRREDLNGNYPSPYDQSHTISLHGRYQFNDYQHFSVKFRFSTGLPYAAITGRVMDASGTYQPVYGQENGSRFPIREELVLRYDVYFFGKDAHFYLELVNVLFFLRYIFDQNIISYIYDADYANYANPEKKFDLPLIPSFGIEYRF